MPGGREAFTSKTWPNYNGASTFKNIITFKDLRDWAIASRRRWKFVVGPTWCRRFLRVRPHLHCHILPGIGDGAPDLGMALEMARASVADGVSVLACTPHILPGLYDNAGPVIRQAVVALQHVLDQEAIPLRLITGADVHITPDFAAGLRSGRLLSLADGRYVLVEPPHRMMPLRMEEALSDLQRAG